MSSVAALYYDGRSARPQPVVLDASAAHLTVSGSNFRVDVPFHDLRVTPRLARLRRVLRLPDGAQIHCDDNDWIDALFPRKGLDAVVDRLERYPFAVASSLLVVVCVGAMFFVYGLPILAERAARVMPVAAEVGLGEQTLSMLDQMMLQPTQLSANQQDHARDQLNRLVEDTPNADLYTLAFRRLPGNVANAFALPGGTIVLSDGLVEALADDDAVLAVIAHEMGHEVQHHVIRSVLQSSVVVVLVSLFTGDVSAATGIVLGVPVFLLNSHYSRDFERAADDYAFAALREHHVSPEWFAYALEAIDFDARSARHDSSGGIESYTSSHPSSADRTAAARAAAVGFDPLEVLIAEHNAARLGRGLNLAKTALVGCWTGGRTIDRVQVSRWYVRFAADQSFVARFERTDSSANLSSTFMNSGRWATQDDIMTLRTLSYTVKADEARETESFESYQIGHFEPEVMRYASLPAREGFESRRVACLDSVFAPDGHIPPFVGGGQRPKAISQRRADRDVVPVNRVNPMYPNDARLRGIEGWVQLKFNVSSTGSVTDVVVVDDEPHGVFDESAAAALRRWQYAPRIEGGHAIEQRDVEVVLRFELER